MNIENSRHYYGDVLQGSGDLLTDACTMADAPPPHVRRALTNVHDEVKARYYGCGLVAPSAIKGARILDLGSGSGQDAYLLAQLVGEAGSVVGVDTTPAQLEAMIQVRLPPSTFCSLMFLSTRHLDDARTRREKSTRHSKGCCQARRPGSRRLRPWP